MAKLQGRGFAAPPGVALRRTSAEGGPGVTDHRLQFSSFLTLFAILWVSLIDNGYCATVEEGWKLYQLGEFNRAIAVFQQLQSSPATPAERIQGIYGEAACWNYRQDGRSPAKAIALYQEIVKSAPDNTLAPWSALDAVRAKYLGVVDNYHKTAEMAAAYTSVAETYPGTDAGIEALLAACNLESANATPKQAETIVARVDQFLQSHPQSNYRSRFYLVLAHCCKLLDRPESRLQALIAALDSCEVDPANPNATNAAMLWAIAYLAEFETGDFSIARKYYQRLISQYPRDLRIFATRRALKRMEQVEACIRENREIPAEWLSEHP